MDAHTHLSLPESHSLPNATRSGAAPVSNVQPTALPLPLCKTARPDNSSPCLLDKPARQLPQQPAFRYKWVQLASWKCLLALSLLLPSGVGLSAFLVLLYPPALPNCSLLLPIGTTESQRLYCAQQSASQKTEDGLLSAIALVRSLPSTHPLSQERDRLIEQWSMQLLNLSKATFQRGNFPEALAILQKIPTSTSAHKLVDGQRKQWKTIWSKAEAIDRQAQAKMHRGEWQQAFSKAAELLNVDNSYWKTTKYEELIHLIQTEASIYGYPEEVIEWSIDTDLPLKKSTPPNKTDEAFRKVQSRKVHPRKRFSPTASTPLTISTNPLQQNVNKQTFPIVASEAKAIEVPQQGVSSPSGLTTQEDLPGSDSAKLLKSSNEVDSSSVGAEKDRPMQLMRAVNEEAPVKGDQPTPAITSKDMEQAVRLAAAGTPETLQAAIETAQRVPESCPCQGDAKLAIASWSQEILQQAREQSVNDLSQAIATAQRVPEGSAAYTTAQAQIDAWQQLLTAQTARESNPNKLR